MSLFTSETLGWLCAVPGAMPFVVGRPNCFGFYVASVSQKPKDESNNSTLSWLLKSWQSDI